jgi:hypothetical protein
MGFNASAAKVRSTVPRGLRDIAQAFVKSGSTAVISGESIHLPAELAREAIPFDLDLPDREELQLVVHQILRTLQRQRELTVTLGPYGMESLLQALSGLTLNQARQAVAWAVLDDNALTADDIPRLLRHKGEAVREEGLLEFYPPEDNTFQLGGLEHLKAWLERARVGFTEEARALGLSPPRGSLANRRRTCGRRWTSRKRSRRAFSGLTRSKKVLPRAAKPTRACPSACWGRS